MYLIIVALACALIIWGLMEAVFHDYQRTKFLDTLIEGQMVKLNGNFVFIDAIYNNRILVSNIYLDTLWVDKWKLEPEEPYLAAIPFITKHILD